MVGSVVSAKQFTVQFEPVHLSYYSWGERVDEQINAYIDKGYKVVSMVPIVNNTRTIYIVVVFDDMKE
ncbi:MAG: hypothetical protein J6P07_06715 [Spirochaetaceae bacterium]|nr:hypothetical protein [Spirochaetaceae bacterium]